MSLRRFPQALTDSTGPLSWPGPRRRMVLPTALLAALALLALTATPAFAFPAPRTFGDEITEFYPEGIAVDSSGNVWSSNHQALFEYGTYPSTTQIGEQPEGAFARSLARDSANGNVYGAFGSSIVPFEDGTGPALEPLEFGSFSGIYFLRVATDNSSPSTGRIYVSGITGVRALESNGTNHEFTDHAPYISANELTGTPSGPFGELTNIATDTKGDIYVVDRGRRVVDEFRPGGEFIREITGAGAPGGFENEPDAVAIDPTTGNVLVSVRFSGVDEFDPYGGYLSQLTDAYESGQGAAFGNGPDTIAINSKGDLYVNPGSEAPGIDIFTRTPDYPTISYRPISNLTRDSVTLGASVGPYEGGPITECKFEYGTGTDYALGSEPCLNGEGHEIGTEANPINSEPPTEVHADLTAKLDGNTTYHYRLVLTNATGTLDVADRQFETPPAVVDLETGNANPIGNVSATLHGSFTAEAGIETEYFFEYGTSANFGHKEPVPPGVIPAGVGSQPESISTEVEGLAPNTTYHFRLVARNKYGMTKAPEEEFSTYRVPAIEAFSTSEVTATSAVLRAKVNPEGFETTCEFEYGVSSTYGQNAPCPEPLEGALGKAVQVKLINLERGVTYHFRVKAQNKWGVVVSEDQTFEFFPPNCPNAAVRQQTGAAYLPDCRAYELVSPANANGSLLFANGPNPGSATSPSRFSFSAAFSALPGSEVIDTAGDLYVATRTNSGWVSQYVGLPGDLAGCDGGPPTDPVNDAPGGPVIQNSVLTNPDMSRFLDWNDGTGDMCLAGPYSATSDSNVATDPPSDAPYLWGSDGTLLNRLPSSLKSTPGASEAFTCPVYEASGYQALYIGAIAECSGEVTASGDLTQLIFSSRSLSFSGPGEPAGLTQAPGSAYDENLATGKVALISRLGGGAPIPQDPSFASVPRGPSEPGFSPGGQEEFLRFPATSTDGSHVLISTATAPTPTCLYFFQGTCHRYTDTPIHLYMSVDDAVTKEISVNENTGENVGVNFLSMTPDGSKVFFTSEDHLTAEDTEHGGPALYMWSEAGEEQGHPLTLVSKGDNPGNNGEPGNTAACNPVGEWTTECGVTVYSAASYLLRSGGTAGNGISDSPIASDNGDIYFSSPEQLDGDLGVLNQQNLYDYRNGRVQYVATLGSGPITRIEVTPTDSHMAFVTASRLTSYDNAGHLEMYSYSPGTGDIVCDSCNPNGRPATADVEASQDGRFLTDDGRAFFSTTESLVPSDTNEAEDVYEFVDSRPQLITPGTGTATLSTQTFITSKEVPGLIGVSGDGTDVYFSTFDTLLSEDHNGNFMKFYDARTNGGFAQPPPTPPCEAAEECHGPGSEAPALPTQGTAADLTGGNATSTSRHDKSRRRAEHRRHHRRAHSRRIGR